MSLKMLDGSDVPYELLLTTKQTTKLRNAFNNNKSTDSRLSKAQISKIIPSGEFLGSLLSKLAGSLIKVAISLAKNPLALLGVTADASSIDAGTQKKIFGSGTIKILNNEINDVIKIVQVF